MRTLAIETSCDETAIAILEAEGDDKAARFRVLGNALLSQIELHRQYGGVFPAMAKREHAKNLVPILESALEEAELLREDTQSMPHDIHEAVAALLEREPGLSEQFLEFIGEIEKPAIDAIAVTAGPGLEPALWVGINFAKALALVWDLPIVSANHMEGHILSALARKEDGAQSGLANGEDSAALVIDGVAMPVLALLISGGHTELVSMDEWLRYRLIGQTRDDAVGEAFDKVARMLGLPYPGGPEVSRLAELARKSETNENKYVLPRPMIDSGDCDFSFAGLKTAVLYQLRENPEYAAGQPVPQEVQEQLALAFEDAAADVLWKKSAKALEETGANTLVLGGGVSANTHIRRVFRENIEKEFPGVSLRIPSADLTTDNAIMIALAGFYHAARGDFADPVSLAANGNRSLA
jgi:N6-L-threonylcarbamoyladenine synthase